VGKPEVRKNRCLGVMEIVKKDLIISINESIDTGVESTMSSNRTKRIKGRGTYYLLVGVCLLVMYIITKDITRGIVAIFFVALGMIFIFIWKMREEEKWKASDIRRIRNPYEKLSKPLIIFNVIILNASIILWIIFRQEIFILLFALTSVIVVSLSLGLSVITDMVSKKPDIKSEKNDKKNEARKKRRKKIRRKRMKRFRRGK
jgi:hypothetical protein